MAVQTIQPRRGSTAAHAPFVGLLGEITVDTTKHSVVVHDGTTAGGFPLALEGSGGGLADVVSDTTPQLGGQLDVNGQAIGDGTRELLKFSETGSAVNELTIANAATGSGPTLSATGDDTNIDINLTPKGTGVVNIGGQPVLSTTVTTPADGDILEYVTDEFVNAKPKEALVVACSDETTALTTGTAKATFRMPFAMTLSAVRASVTTAPTGTGNLTVDINDGGATILSTKLTFDASEKTTTTATTAAVISDTALADDAEITVDIDAVSGTVTGAGLKVYLIGRRA